MRLKFNPLIFQEDDPEKVLGEVYRYLRESKPMEAYTRIQQYYYLKEMNTHAKNTIEAYERWLKNET